MRLDFQSNSCIFNALMYHSSSCLMYYIKHNSLEFISQAHRHGWLLNRVALGRTVPYRAVLQIAVSKATSPALIRCLY